MTSEIINPTESRREFLKKIPSRTAKIAALASVPMIVVGCLSSKDLQPSLMEDVDAFLNEFYVVKQAGKDGAQGVLIAQFGLESGGFKNQVSYMDSISSEFSGLFDEPTNPVSLAYIGNKYNIRPDLLLEQYNLIQEQFDGQGLSVDFTGLSISTGKTPEELKNLYDKVSNFNHLRAFGFIDSTDAVEVITSIAAHEDMETAQNIFNQIDESYHGDRNLPRAILTLASYISGDTKATMEKFDMVNAHNFGLFADPYEENKAGLVLATSTGRYTIEQALDMYHYIGNKTNFSSGDIARIIVGMVAAKDGLSLISREIGIYVFTGKTGYTKHLIVPLLLEKPKKA